MTFTENRAFSNDICRRLLDKARNTITEFGMIRTGESVLIGVSGGPDSIALMHVLVDLAPELSIELAVAHLNHGLREEAGEEAAFVARHCDRLGLVCHTRKVDVDRHHRRYKLSIEEAGRRLRYAFYASVREKYGYDKIALGHHADDNAELVLMFLLRGCGSVGISGIPPVRDGIIIRPLIRLSREDIRDYLDASDLKSISDRSNQDNRFLRNRIRNQLIPLLQQSYNPQIIPAINRLADISRDENKWMTDVTVLNLSNARLRSAGGLCCLSVAYLAHLPVAARRRVIREAIAEVKGDLRRISYAHVDSILRLIESYRQQSVVALPVGLAVRRSGDTLYIMSEGHGEAVRAGAAKEPCSSPFIYRVERPQSPLHSPVIVHLKEIGRKVTFAMMEVKDGSTVYKTGQNVAFFDMSSLAFPLTLRSVQPGDRFTPLGLKGSQKVKKFFIDHKIPQKRRWQCPVLVSGEDIVWLVGHRIADRCKATPDTRWLLRAELGC